jgi:hypothetical protein
LKLFPKAETQFEIQLIPPDNSIRTRHDMGWTQLMERLKIIAEAGDPGPNPGCPGGTPRFSSFQPQVKTMRHDRISSRYSPRSGLASMKISLMRGSLSATAAFYLLFDFRLQAVQLHIPKLIEEFTNTVGEAEKPRNKIANFANEAEQDP